MLGILRQPLLKSVKIAQFGVKKFAQPIPRVLKKSCSQCGSYRPYPGPSALENIKGCIKVVLMWPLFVPFYFYYKCAYEGYKEYHEEKSKKPEM